MTLVLHLPSVEQYECSVLAREHPTSAFVDFTLTAADLDGTETWVPGEWEGTVVQTDSQWLARAVTPPIGPGQQLAPTEGTWLAWCRIGGVGGVIKFAGVLRVT